MKLSPIRQEYAKAMRGNPTKAEQLLWRLLRNRNFHGYKFRRQQQLGQYIADFVCYEPKLIIELDGIHHSDQYKLQDDNERTKELNKMGFQVIRFQNSQVDEAWGDVVKLIEKMLFTLTPCHLSQNGRGENSAQLNGRGAHI